MPAAVPELIDIETLARQLGDSVRHVRRLVAERRIPYLKVGHFVRFDPDEIVAWLDAQRVGARGRLDVVPVANNGPLKGRRRQERRSTSRGTGETDTTGRPPSEPEMTLGLWPSEGLGTGSRKEGRRETIGGFQ
jgi:excisionase family DNA binding protein